MIFNSLFFGNSKTFKKARKFFYKRNFVNFLSILFEIPCVPLRNLQAKSDIRRIKKNGNIYKLPNRNTVFFLPDLDLSGGELIQNRVFLEQDYFEIEHLSHIRSFIPNNANILDIGANIGNHSLYFAKECNAKRIYSFEPTPKTFSYLCKNVEINNLNDIVFPKNCALGKICGEGSLKVVDRNDAGSNQVLVGNSGDIVIKSLDSISFTEHIDFVKIDVEGFEFDVLSGGKEFLEKNEPVIMIEIFDKNFDKVNNLLASYGYEIKDKADVDYIYIKK